MKTARDLIDDLFDVRPSRRFFPVVATTPHGTYTFEIVSVKESDGRVVLALREIPTKETL